MCENQCSVVASEFSAFFFLLKKLDICVQKSVLRGCFTLFQFFFLFLKNFIYAFKNQCCVVASAFFIFFSQNLIMAELICVKISVALLRKFFFIFFCFFKNFIYAFENQCCMVASAFFIFFSQNLIGVFLDMCGMVA